MPTKEIKDKLLALVAAYTKNLPDKIAGIEKQWLDLQDHWDQKKFQNFHRVVHSLCGSAGTYGYMELGKSARQLEICLKSSLNNPAISVEKKKEITDLLSALKKTFEQAVPEKFQDENIQPIKISANNIIYILNEDDYFIDEVGKQIKESGYNLSRIANIAEFKKVVQEKVPIALIVDIQSIGEDNIHMLNGIQKKLSIPLFCTAANGDILSRLKAIRMGSWVFLQKPIDPFYLLKTLKQHCGLVEVEPYHILIVDDSRSLAEYFSLVLQEAGMITRFITNPLLLIETIDEFQPDLLLMDIYMPECNGLELAAVLRQEVRHMKIPIIFLSTEDDRSKQLSALNLGGDDFLTKPILPQHLIEVVKSRAKRSGILNSFIIRDSLTGLLNHTNILHRLDIELARAERQGEALSFVMIDIDHFKKVNDMYGHPAGDEILKSLSTLLYSSLRKNDAVGRYGGEEFALILTNTDMANSIKICNYLREKFSRIPHQLNQTDFFVTFSAGIASFPYLQDAKSLVNCADIALYAAKKNGRNQIVFYEEQLKSDITS